MTRTTAKEAMYRRIAQHGENLLRIFPNAKIRNPVELCKRLRRREANAAKLALGQCNGDDGLADESRDVLYEAILRDVNEILGNVPQSKTGERCGCKRGQERDNCPACEGTGERINFKAVREFKRVPVFINRDPRGYALKIDDSWMREANAALHRDWGGYGIIAPDLTEDE